MFTQAFHQRLFPSDDAKSSLYSTFVPAIVVFMAVYLRGAATTYGSHQQRFHRTRLARRAAVDDERLPPLTTMSSKWIHHSSTMLVGMAATYLTLMVLVECTVRVLLLKAGIGLGGTVRILSYRDEIARQVEHAMDRHIEGSLREVNLHELLADANDTDTDDDEEEEHSDSDSDVDRAIGPCRVCDDVVPSFRPPVPESCAICLEEFGPGDTVVAGRKSCCKSNRFHKDCIQKWLRISDSCPCCRSNMLDTDDEGSTENATATTHTTHARYLRSQFRIRIDTATRLRNEILTYFID